MDDIETFFIPDNDIFDSDDNSEANRRFIMDLIDGTSFITDAKKFVEDTQASQMEIFDNSTKQKMEKKEQMLIEDDEKRRGAHSENRLMKQVNIKNEFLNKTEKNRKRVKKSYRENIKSRIGEY